jgi:hypothetical protein
MGAFLGSHLYMHTCRHSIEQASSWAGDHVKRYILASYRSNVQWIQ